MNERLKALTTVCFVIFEKSWYKTLPNRNTLKDRQGRGDGYSLGIMSVINRMKFQQIEQYHIYSCLFQLIPVK